MRTDSVRNGVCPPWQAGLEAVLHGCDLATATAIGQDGVGHLDAVEGGSRGPPALDRLAAYVGRTVCPVGPVRGARSFDRPFAPGPIGRRPLPVSPLAAGPGRSSVLLQWADVGEPKCHDGRCFNSVPDGTR